MVARTTLSHYKLLGELGRGGMGVVYRARDLKLKREVALKVLPEEGLDPQTMSRFILEAQSAAALKHPNIAVVHEIDEAEGVTFIAMELVEGRRLRDVVREEGLPLERALRLAVEIAQGLSHAHRKGIVHRDLKPNNIMITDEGHAKIIDFGLAKLIEPLVEAESDILRAMPEKTESGVLVGTLSYMSPEQARGEKIDHRSDIFSFGTVLFEMLTGASPFQRAKAVETLAAILRDPTPRLEESLHDRGPLAPELQPLVDRCLAKEPSERFENMEGVVSELSSALRSSENLRLAVPATFVGSAEVTERAAAVSAPASRRHGRLAALGALALAAAGVLWFALSPDAPPSSSVETPLVAVGPFENLTGDAELAWLDAGLSNLVRDKLAQSRQLVTVSKARWGSIRGASTDDAARHAAAASTGVDYVVSGELLPSPRGIVLTARLSDLASGTDDFAYSFEDLTPEEVLARADGIASLAKQGIGVPPEETVDSFAADVAVDNIAAYQSYVGGLEYFQDFEYAKAEQAFRLALELEPDFAIASYRLAHLYAATGRRELAQTTIAAIPENARLTRREHLYVDAARALFELDYVRAISTYHTLLAEFPYDVEGRQFLAEAYFLNYEDGKAIDELRKLGAQEPENEYVWSALATYLILSGRAEEARAPLNRYKALAPEDPHPHTLLGDLERQLGNYEAAEREFREGLARDAKFSLARLGLGQTIALMGRFDEASEIWAGVIADAEVEPEDRVTAALDLANVRRAQYRFEESLVPLQRLEPEIHEEEVRESLALATRAMSALELGRSDDAARWIDEAIERATGAKTRYVFARGLLELKLDRLDDALETARQIREYERPRGSEGETERKAAAYLEGWVALKQGDTAASRAHFQESVELTGYAYSIYDRGLAEALRAAGDLGLAAEAAERAVAFHDPGEVRLDLELDRARAQLLLARTLAEQGKVEASRAAARQYLDRWGDDEVDHPDLRAARALLQASSP